MTQEQRNQVLDARGTRRNIEASIPNSLPSPIPLLVGPVQLFQ